MLRNHMLDTGTSKILVVDDSRSNLLLLGDILSNSGYSVVSADSGVQALNMLADEAPDLVLLDIEMPQMDGYETCRRIKQNEASRVVPVIFLSSLQNPNDKVKGFEAGAVDYVTKPFQEKELLARVETHLELRYLQKDLEIQNSRLQQEIMERTRIESELQKSKADLEQMVIELKTAQSRILQQEKMASIGQLAAGVAHEINNPIGFIISNLSSLQKYMNKMVEFISADIERVSCGQLPECHEHFEQLSAHKKSLKLDYIIRDVGMLIAESNEGADRIKKIVQDLKTFSHLNEDQLKIADINAGLESTINIVYNELKYKARLVKELGNIPQTVCNLGQLNQVFMNVLVNAAQSMESLGEIAVRSHCDGGNIVVSISDTGCGIPEDKLDRIFEPFYTTKDVGKGTGLGLSIAYDIIKKHGGEIKVESRVGSGTTFRIYIPVVQV
jgi:two-component system, NtrC family, sensor kinase